jgi:hypothetical protein
MNEIKIGFARVSTLEQDVSVQRDALVRLGIDEALDIPVPLNQVTEVEACPVCSPTSWRSAPRIGS